MSDKSFFADVILPIPIPQLFTYHIPQDLIDKIKPGKRVVVQFGNRKIYSALVKNIHNNKPTSYKTKDIVSVLDNEAIINDTQFKFWQWISEYYMCSLGEVYKAALPSGLKLESETKILPNINFSDFSNFSDNEELIFNALANKNVLTIKETNALTDRKNSLPIIKSLLDKKAIFVEEKLKDTYKPKIEKYVSINPEITNEELNNVFDKLSKAQKQLELLMAYIKLSNFFQKDALAEVKKTDLLKISNAAQQTYSSLIKKNIFSEHEKEISRIIKGENGTSEKNTLNTHQQKALKEIKENFKTKDVVLLQGVTSSGKTEIYIHLINETITAGRQVLYLLPEIALTTQIINRLKKVFGEKIGVYHSKFNDYERVEIWNNIVNKDSEKKYDVILGVRSSVFLPFSNLGLIIIDEEHENTYKQFDPAPRYNARDAAIVLAKLHGAKTLLGTATPSIETFYNTKNNKFALVELKHRYKDIEMPEIIVADIHRATLKKQMNSMFTPTLLENIQLALDNKEQIILFQNRRGFSPYLQCETCGWIPHCKNCDVSLTYHKHSNNLVCHYCGYTTKITNTCEACGSSTMQTKGFGTEKIEDEMSIFFPDAKIARMDLDTTRSKNAYQKIIQNFENHNIDILIGTQMISKGLDFDNVSVVGILNADNMLYYPDFRAFERSYQLMSQVSGRAGRKNKRGRVIIQTTNPKHKIINNVIDSDYEGMFKSELIDRKQFRYPPYTRIIKITLKHKNIDTLNKASQKFATELKRIFRNRIIGPQSPIINKIQLFYLKTILIKIEKTKSISQTKQIISKSADQINTLDNYNSLHIVIDVDPYN
ncbi:MAG: primosomal protein N' [Bacteroidetes bacterium]|nr:MAG: primosomal protein N' [Bacteroidota bacterium]